MKPKYRRKDLKKFCSDVDLGLALIRHAGVLVPPLMDTLDEATDILIEEDRNPHTTMEMMMSLKSFLERAAEDMWKEKFRRIKERSAADATQAAGGRESER